MTDRVYEVTITTKDAENREHTSHAEYATSADTPKGAADELAEAARQKYGARQFKDVDATR